MLPSTRKKAVLNKSFPSIAGLMEGEPTMAAIPLHSDAISFIAFLHLLLSEDRTHFKIYVND